MNTLTTAHPPSGDQGPHDDFLALSPLVTRHARFAFRFLGDEAREEAVAEAVAAAFVAHVALKARGRNPAHFPSRLAAYGVLQVKDGRRVGGSSSSRDVLSHKAQKRRCFRVHSLPATTRGPYEKPYTEVRGQKEQNALEECLRDNTRTPVPEQVAFRLDFPAFLRGLSVRDRWMALALARGHAATQVACQFGLTAGRVTQLRQRWRLDWLAFQGEAKSSSFTPSPSSPP